MGVDLLANHALEGSMVDEELMEALQKNIMLANLKLRCFPELVELASKFLARDPTHIKVLYRRAMGYIGLEKLQSAHQDLSCIVMLDPTNRDAKRRLWEVVRKLQQPIGAERDDQRSAMALETNFVPGSITEKAQELSSQIKSHMEAVFTAMEDLKNAEANITQIRLKYKEEEGHCYSAIAVEKKGVAKCKAEGELLRRMANPYCKDVFSEHGVVWGTEDPGGSYHVGGKSAQGLSSTPKTSSYNKQPKRRKNPDCTQVDAARQEEASIAYRKIPQLIGEAEERVNAFDNRLRGKRMRMDVDLRTLTAVRDQVSDRLYSAINSMAALSPSLDILEVLVGELNNGVTVRDPTHPFKECSEPVKNAS